MEVKVLRTFPMEQAFDALRVATLDAADGDDIRLYHDAKMKLADFDPEDLNPTSLYVLRKSLDFQIELRLHLLGEYGIDTLNLSQVVHLDTPDGVVGLVPPFVEIVDESVTFTGREGNRTPPDNATLRVPVLKDGIHRAFLARSLGVQLRCVVVRTEVSLEYPTYAYPNRWSDVRVYDAVPPVKKHYRRENAYTFMRPIYALRLLDVGESREYGR